MGSGRPVLPLSHQVDARALSSRAIHRRSRLCPVGRRAGRAGVCRICARVPLRRGRRALLENEHRSLEAACSGHGAHDALDGFITFRQARHAQMNLGEGAATALSGAIESLSLLCRHRDWTTEDPLSLGGLLFDACRLCRLPGEERSDDADLLEELTSGCSNGLMAFLAGRQLSWLS